MGYIKTVTYWLIILFALFCLIRFVVGLSRYSSHSSPVCDRKDFVLNLNGISSLHPSTSGSYYHQLQHHHQSVYQDVKPCVIWHQTVLEQIIYTCDEKRNLSTMIPLLHPAKLSTWNCFFLLPVWNFEWAFFTLWGAPGWIWEHYSLKSFCF